jgi:hypothetical protein
VANYQKIIEGAYLVVYFVLQVLHPLKSETNFPIGERVHLDLQEQRWLLPMHILEGTLFASGYKKRVHLGDVALTESEDIILRDLTLAFAEGFDSMALQRSPHLLILQPDFYFKTLKPHIAAWTMIWLKQQTAIIKALEATTEELPESCNKEILFEKYISMEEANIGFCESEQYRGCIPLLNLAKSWVNQFTLHCLSKRNRIDFGLIQQSDIDAWRLELKQDVVLATSRKLLAVPFIGKDVPSRVSEFSNPDVCIGLTFLAYNYEGLRASDISDLLFSMKRSYASESGPVESRNSWIEFAHFINDDYQPHSPDVPVLPLDLIQPSDPFQLKNTVSVLTKSSPVIFKYCRQCYAVTMQFNRRKLQASGIDVGGTMLFQTILGFSGTPSNLLPVSLGKCIFEEGCEARIVKILTSLDHVRPIYPLPTCEKWKHLFGDDTDWSVESILIGIATADPPYHALIDAGAIITGFRNEEVARYLLRNGLASFKACVFLDDSGSKMALVRTGAEISSVAVPLEQCGVHLSARFCFFDQIHTTGTDMKMPMDAKAIVTVGKGMTLRDHAQACWRMRGLENGQTLDVLIVTEIFKLIGIDQSCNLSSNFDNESDVLNSLLVWLIKNGLHSENLQRIAFSARKILDCWRTRSLDRLLSSSASNTSGKETNFDDSILTTRFNSDYKGFDIPFDLTAAKQKLESSNKSKIQNQSKSRYSNTIIQTGRSKQLLISALCELPANVKIRSWIEPRLFFFYAVMEMRYVIKSKALTSEEKVLSYFFENAEWLFSENKSNEIQSWLEQKRSVDCEGSIESIPVSLHQPGIDEIDQSKSPNLSTCLNVFIENLDHSISDCFQQKESIVSALKKLDQVYACLLHQSGTERQAVANMLDELEKLTNTRAAGHRPSQDVDR